MCQNLPVSSGSWKLPPKFLHPHHSLAPKNSSGADRLPHRACLSSIMEPWVWKIIWCYTYPSEKYGLVSWDDEIHENPNIWKGKMYDSVEWMKCMKFPTW